MCGGIVLGRRTLAHFASLGFEVLQKRHVSFLDLKNITNMEVICKYILGKMREALKKSFLSVLQRYVHWTSTFN